MNAWPNRVTFLLLVGTMLALVLAFATPGVTFAQDEPPPWPDISGAAVAA